MGDPKDAQQAKARAAAKREQERRDRNAVKKVANRKAKAAERKATAKRARHNDTDYEKLLRAAEEREWSIIKDDGYFKCYCPCADKHYVSVVLTASSSRTLKNTKAKFEGKSCWKEMP